MPRSDYYNDEGEATKERCPRCEDAFLADHDDRKHCGRCGYTEWT
jgi:small subunit ribosomal protein S27Ae